MPETTWVDRLIKYADNVRREVPAWALQSGRDANRDVGSPRPEVEGAGPPSTPEVK